MLMHTLCHIVDVCDVWALLRIRINTHVNQISQLQIRTIAGKWDAIHENLKDPTSYKTKEQWAFEHFFCIFNSTLSKKETLSKLLKRCKHVFHHNTINQISQDSLPLTSRGNTDHAPPPPPYPYHAIPDLAQGRVVDDLVRVLPSPG